MIHCFSRKKNKANDNYFSIIYIKIKDYDKHKKGRKPVFSALIPLINLRMYTD